MNQIDQVISGQILSDIFSGTLLSSVLPLSLVEQAAQSGAPENPEDTDRLLQKFNPQEPALIQDWAQVYQTWGNPQPAPAALAPPVESVAPTIALAWYSESLPEIASLLSQMELLKMAGEHRCAAEQALSEDVAGIRRLLRAASLYLRAGYTRQACECLGGYGRAMADFHRQRGKSDQSKTLMVEALRLAVLPLPLLGADPITLPQLTSESAKLPKSIASQNHFLAISLNGEKLFIVSKEPGTENRVGFCREFIPESLYGFSECDYEIWNRDNLLSRGKLDRSKYPQILKRDFEQFQEELERPVQVIFKVSHLSTIKIILHILGKLANDYHTRMIVHGDVKPQNCLVTLDGCALINGFGLHVGDLPTGMGSSWFAPEQVAFKPISAATDIYPIGLMLISLFSAQLAGEIVRYRIPQEKGYQVISIFRDPIVCLDSQGSTRSVEGQKAWAGFIEKCLRFNSSDRFRDASECALELGRLVGKFPPSGPSPFN